MNKKIISVILAVLLVSINFELIVFAKGFSDIGGHWAKSDIEELADKGIINGTDKNSFNPEGSVSREEFAKLIACCFQAEFNKTTDDFNDVQPDAWSNKYISYCIDKGIIVPKGYGANFEPEKAVTRDEMAKWIFRALNLEISGENVSFSDIDNNSDYIRSTVSAGILKGFEDGTFRPNENMTRAEAAVVIKRILNSIENKSVSDQKAIEKTDTSESTSTPTPDANQISESTSTPTPDANQISESTSTPTPDANQISEISVVPANVAMGSDHTLYAKYDGTVWSEGNNNYGQLGRSENFDKLNATSDCKQVEDLKDIVAVYATLKSSFAVDKNGDVWAWDMFIRKC